MQPVPTRIHIFLFNFFFFCSLPHLILSKISDVCKMFQHTPSPTTKWQKKKICFFLVLCSSKCLFAIAQSHLNILSWMVKNWQSYTCHYISRLSHLNIFCTCYCFTKYQRICQNVHILYHSSWPYIHLFKTPKVRGHHIYFLDIVMWTWQKWGNNRKAPYQPCVWTI